MAKVLLDYDSTVADLVGAQVRAANERFGTRYRVEDVDSWSWWFDRCPKEHRDHVWGPECFGSWGWTADLPEVPGALEGVYALCDAGHEFVVVSDREPWMACWIWRWFWDRGVSVPVVISHKTACPKVEVARQLGLTVAIEDAPHHAVDLAEAGVRTVLLDRPYNRNVEPHPNLTRAHGWPEVVAALTGREEAA